MSAAPRCVLLLLCLVSATVLPGCSETTHPEGMPSGTESGKIVHLKLQRGMFPVRCYEPQSKPLALIVFGSGDGGWSDWEERACRSLAMAGFRVIGWDCRSYAGKPYAAGVLGADLTIMRKTGLREGLLPVLYGGYSTGAEQAVAAAAWSREAENARSHGGALSAVSPTGLLLVAPGSRGRYGITFADLMGLTPRGKNSFALADLLPRVGGIPIAQIHGTLDPLDSSSWLDGWNGRHRIFTLRGSGHTFGNADGELRSTLDEAASWLLQGKQ